MHGTGAALRTLPGLSAKTLLFRGFAFLAACFPLLVVIVFESKLPGRWYYWGIPSILVIVLFAAISFTVTGHGYGKEHRELKAGYTTMWLVAVNVPAAYYLTADLTTIISGPNEPRPKTGRAADERAHLQARAGKTPAPEPERG